MCIVRYKNNKSEHITYHGNEVRIYRIWQGQKGSNPRHSVLETDALPAELYPYNKKMLVMVDHHGLEPRTDRL